MKNKNQCLPLKTVLARPHGLELAHVVNLAARFGIKIQCLDRETPAQWFGADQPTRRVRIPWIAPGDTTAYAIALHEIGHIAVGHGSVRPGNIAEETAAWRWARSHATRWDPRMDQCAFRGLTSHMSARMVKTGKPIPARSSAWRFLESVSPLDRRFLALWFDHATRKRRPAIPAT